MIVPLLLYSLSFFRSPASGEVPAVKAYDSYMKNSVSYLAQACDDLGELENMGDLIQKAWEGIRLVIVLASRSKAPEEDLTEALAPHMKSVQEAVVGIRSLKLERNWDRHQKAVIEMMAGLSWVYLRAPKALPAAMVKETLGSAEFWSNRIRKDFKGKNDTHIAFCDSIKAVITGLAEYIDEHHKTGLTFSPRGVSLAEAAIRLSDPTQEDTSESQRQGSFRVRHPMIGSAVVGGNIAGMMEELSKRKSTEGDSAATGLKKVRTNTVCVLCRSCTVCLYSIKLTDSTVAASTSPCRSRKTCRHGARNSNRRTERQLLCRWYHPSQRKRKRRHR